MISIQTVLQHIAEQFHITVRNDYREDRLIYRAEILSSHTILDENTLYILNETYLPDLKESPALLPGNEKKYFLLTDCCENIPLADHCENILMTNRNADDPMIPAKQELPFHMLCMTSSCPADKLCSSVNDFIKFETLIEQHSNQLYRTLYHSRGLKDLVNIAEGFLKHPISVCDSSYNIMVASPKMKQIPYGLDHNQSRTFLKSEEIESLQRLQIEDKIYENSRAFFSRTADHPDSNWIFCAIRIQNVMTGYVAVCLEADIEATEYELRITTALADACAIEMQKHEFFVTRSGMKYENFLIDLLEGRFNDVNLISTRLELLDRKFCKFFCLVVLSCMEPHDNNIFNKRQMAVLRQVYPNSMSVVYQDAIVLFMNQDEPILMKDTFIRPLEEFARRNHMKAGISQPFADILRINSYYRQAINTLNLGEACDSGAILYFGADLLPQFLFSKADYTGLAVGIHHHLHHLKDYDRENHTEFITTLKAYLQNDRNATKAAEALHIHRSTFFYRIKKIEELLDISITDSKLLFLYELSFKIWDYLSTC